MATFGKIDTVAAQNGDHEYDSVFRFLEENDLKEYFEKVKPGCPLKVTVEEDFAYAIFQEYTTKQPSEARLEGHENFTDIQYIYQGSERIWVADKDYLIDYTEEYNPEADIYFCTAQKYSVIELDAGDAALLTPDDLHAPGICLDTPQTVKKIVFKIRTY